MSRLYLSHIPIPTSKANSIGFKINITTFFIFCCFVLYFFHFFIFFVFGCNVAKSYPSWGLHVVIDFNQGRDLFEEEES